MTKEIKKLMRKREVLRAKYLNPLSLEDKGNYKIVRNKVKQDMRNAKIRFGQKRSEEYKNVIWTLRPFCICPLVFLATLVDNV